MKLPVSSITCPNPNCAREHGLFWYVNPCCTARSHRYISWRFFFGSKHGDIIPVTITATFVAPEGTVPAAGLHEEWSGPAAEKEQGSNQISSYQ